LSSYWRIKLRTERGINLGSLLQNLLPSSVWKGSVELIPGFPDIGKMEFRIDFIGNTPQMFQLIDFPFSKTARVSFQNLLFNGVTLA
jgi:hypothetical protein